METTMTVPRGMPTRRGIEEEKLKARLGHPPPFYRVCLRLRGGWRFFPGSGGATSAGLRPRMMVRPQGHWMSPCLCAPPRGQ